MLHSIFEVGVPPLEVAVGKYSMVVAYDDEDIVRRLSVVMHVRKKSAVVTAELETCNNCIRQARSV